MSLDVPPHGPGFSFVDTVHSLEAGKSVYTIKYLDPALPFFQDHFPENPVMPGVLLTEAGAQAAGCLWKEIEGEKPAKHYMLAQILAFKMLRPVYPGQTIRSEAVLERIFGSLAQFSVEISESGEVVASGKLILSKP
jgi:3-hydroxyacyl-[acyl-carrier-protein] dehydratase